GLHDVRSKVTRMGRGEAHAPDAGHLRNARQQFGKAPARGRWVPPGIHNLAQNLNLRVTLVHKAAALSDNLGARAAALRPPCHGHNTEGAMLVAALDNGQISAEALVAAGELGLKTILGVEIQSFHPAVSGLELGEQIRQLRIARRTTHQADLRRALKKALAFLLRHATQHANDFPLGRPGLAEGSQSRENFLRSLFPNAARVIEDDVSILMGIHRAVTPRHQHARNFLRIVYVHLAAESFNIKGFAFTRDNGGNPEVRRRQYLSGHASRRLDTANLNQVIPHGAAQTLQNQYSLKPRL